MKKITIYEMIEHAEAKYIQLWGQEKYNNALATMHYCLEEIIRQGKQINQSYSIDDAFVVALKVINVELAITNGGVKESIDLMYVAAFKIENKSGQMASQLRLAICNHFINIAVDEAKEE